MSILPSPTPTPLLGHLWRWTRDPVSLLTEGARTGPVFRLALWRPVVVGYRPEWNRTVLGDLDTFRSRGSLSGLTPYLAGGVVHADGRHHDERRGELNPHFHSRGLVTLAERVRAVPRAPQGPFEALSWSGNVVRRMLNRAFFDDRFPDRLLARFLAPLQRPAPWPLLPRPALFGRFDAALARVLAQPPPGTLAAALAAMDNAIEEIRVAIAAGYDTTAHTLAWALWHLANSPQWRSLDTLDLVIDETLRLYPAGWLGSRVTHRRVRVGEVDLAAGTMVFYSPFLTHRDPQLWPEPTLFRPDRFRDGRPAWGYLPFSAGRRTCLGTHLARLMLRAALEPFCAGSLGRLGGDARLRSGITIGPTGPLVLWHWPEGGARAPRPG